MIERQDQMSEGKYAEYRHVLTQAVGMSGELDVDTYTRRLPRGSRLLLCSDGLWDVVKNDEMQEIVNSTPTPQEACQKLVDLANARGGPDNITVLLIYT